MFSLKLYKHADNPSPDTYTFHGGVWFNRIQATWPFGRLEVSPKQLIVSIEETPFSDAKIERQFKHEDLEKVEVKKYFPVIAYGIRIIPRDKTKDNIVYFWYTSFGFNKLISALEYSGWVRLDR